MIKRKVKKLSNYLTLNNLNKYANELSLLIKKFSSEDKYYVYKIKSGDNLGSIAQKHGTTIKELQKANGMDEDDYFIIAGRPFNIPGDYEAQVVAATLLGEVGSTNKEAMPAIMAVIKNRAEYRGMSDREIVKEKKQFSYWNGKEESEVLSGKMGREHSLWSYALEIANKEKSDLPDVKGSTHYYAKSMKSPPYWADDTANCWEESEYKDDYHIFGKDTSGKYGSCQPNTK